MRYSSMTFRSPEYNSQRSPAWTSPSKRFFGLGLLFLAGFAVAFFTEMVNRVETLGFRLIGNADPIKAFFAFAGGAVALIFLLRFPETALALFFLVGLIKGDPRLASAPVDLTIAVGGIVVIAVCYRVFAGKQKVHLPPEYLLYPPLLAMMVLSLTYTPDIFGGAEKLLRFVCLTGIGVLSPFVLFDDTRKIRRFFFVMVIGGIALAIQSLATMDGDERLVSPSGLNTELGAASAVAMIVIWAMLFPNWPLLRRFLLYPVLGVLAVALVGSGGRFANVSALICLLVGALLCRKLFGDLLIAGILGALTLPFIRIPQASLEYLSSLAHPTSAMGTRNDLLRLGVKIFSEHPLFGVGIQGFRSLSPNPLTYNYPHNLFLELGSEMGIVAALIFLALAYCAFREIVRQLQNPLSRENTLVPTVFLLLIYVFLDAMVSGDINDLRFMWFVFGLPFVLRNLESVPHAARVPATSQLLPQESGWQPICEPGGTTRWAR